MPPAVAMDNDAAASSGSDDDSRRRLDHDFEDLNERFRLPVAERDYHKQFASLYTRRLEKTTALLEGRAKAKWGKGEAVLSAIYSSSTAKSDFSFSNFNSLYLLNEQS